MIRKLKIKEIWKQAIELYHTARGKNIVTFMIFLLISSAFWVLMALNDELQRDFTLPVKIDNIPSDVTILTDDPLYIDLTLKDKGTSLIRHKWGSAPELKFNFNEINTPGYYLSITPQRLSNAVRSTFGQAATVISMKPDSITIPFTRRPGKLVHIKIETGEIVTAPQYIVSGKLTAVSDTVRLYSIGKIQKSLNYVTTAPVSASGLTDTTTVEVKIIAPEGMRVIPSTVKVNIPVEPLIMKNVKVQVEPINVPAGKTVVTFPSQINVKYLIPMSRFNNDQATMTAVADFRHRSSGSSKIPVMIKDAPTGYNNIELETDSVEYLIEQH